MKLRRVQFIVLLFLCAAPAQAQARRPVVAVLDFGRSDAGRRAADRVAGALAGAAGGKRVALLDRERGRSAARGAGYEGSLNMTLREARDLGAAIGCDFYLTGDSQVIRRSSSQRPVYYEAYATVFVVSSRTGRLVSWSHAHAEDGTPEQAEAALFGRLDSRTAARVLSSISLAQSDESGERAAGPGPDGDAAGDVLDLTESDGQTPPPGVREPAPYRRLRPAYTAEAARAETEATVDVTAEIGADGRVRRVEVVRWAGFGLDEEVAATVRKMNFRPARRGGEAVPSRVLLRYNFRRPSGNGAKPPR